jgi:hypothetical protein
MMLCGISIVFNWLGDVLGLMSCKRNSENRQVLVGFQSTESFGASNMPAAVQRSAIAAFCHRFTLRQTRRTVPIMFSIELVQASERRSFAGSPRRLTVNISSADRRPHSLPAEHSRPVSTGGNVCR